MLPKSWQIESLGSLLEESPQNGYSPNCPEEPTGRWVLGLGALTGNGLDFSQVKPAPINDILVDRFQVHPGDFLISRSNTLDKVGRSALYRGGLEECSYPDLMMRFRVGSSRVDLDYLDAYLRSERVMKYIQRSATGTSGSMKKINQAVVEGIPIVLPSLIEQRQIAAILSIWDEAIGKTERLIEGKERRYLWLLSSLISNMKHPHGHVRDFTSEVSRRNNGATINRVLSVTNNRGFVLPEDQFERRVASSDLSNYKSVTSGQYAYNPSRINVGSIARLDGWDIGVLSPMYVVFKINENKVISDFFLHWLESHEAKERICKSAQGSVRETVSFTDLGAIPFPLPTRDHQEVIAETLNTAQREIDILKKQAEAYRKQKLGLMQKLLTGEWRVKIKE